MAERITLQVKDSAMEALLALPSRPGRHPGVVLAHHRYGHASVVTRDILGRLAALGCAAIAVDHFHSVPAHADDLARIMAMKDSWLAADNAAAIAFLQSHAQVQPDNLAVMGHCLGGRIAFMAAAQFPVFKAAVIYYPTSMFRAPEGAPPAFEALKNIKCPVIGFFGLEDKLIPPRDADRIEAELARVGVRHEFHRYPQAGHAFCNFDVPEDYREAACRDAWERAVVFLRRELKLGAA
jgi:carboxymethylenebutenolidase